VTRRRGRDPSRRWLAVWIVFSLYFVYDAVVQAWLRTTWPNIAQSVVVVAVAAGTVAVWLRSRRYGMAAARVALIRVVSQRSGDVWLNRDEHVAFYGQVKGWGPVRRWLLTRIPEDVLAEGAAGREEFPLGMETFTALAYAGGLFRYHGAYLLDPGTGDARLIPGGRKGLGSLLHTIRALQQGLLTPAPSDVTEMIGQFRRAESMRRLPGETG
jgi:hypothetical protein